MAVFEDEMNLWNECCSCSSEELVVMKLVIKFVGCGSEELVVMKLKMLRP